ncbi:MAG: integrase arm-type DNA-binding domain-containing protein [Methylococcales bacterium]|nr:integrase arm-type DNA-binding domain-containing protein [Methylococcales bacterium]
MPLTDTAIKNAKPQNKPYKITDEKSMYLLVNTNGSKYFRLKYRFAGKEKLLPIGVYPDTSLKMAREDRDNARTLLAKGIDPMLDRKIKKIANTENCFKAIALEWYGKHLASKSENYKNRVINMLERDLFPWLGDRVISEIKPSELLIALRRIESRSIQTAHKALQTCGQIFRYAVATDRAELDITPSLKGALSPINGGHFAAITEPLEAAKLLRAIDNYSGSFVVKSALQLAHLVFVRPSELYNAEWEHISLETKEWRYLVTKTNTQHIVPLSTQAIEILTNLYPLTGKGRFVFPNERTPNGSRAISDMALLVALRSMGFSKEVMTIHGFRAMARTMIEERLKIEYKFFEHQLAHAVRDANGRAYNRTTHLDDRHNMMQTWADYLDSLKAGAVIIPFGKSA